jgi:hypothetical protein
MDIINKKENDTSRYSLLTDEELDKIKNTYRIYKGDTVINFEKLKTDSIKKSENSKEKSIGLNADSQENILSDTNKNKSDNISKTSTKNPTTTKDALSDKMKDEIEYKLEEQETILFIESAFKNIFDFFKHIFDFFYNIDYSDKFIQLSIIVGIFYLLSTAISILHINISI